MNITGRNLLYYRNRNNNNNNFIYGTIKRFWSSSGYKKEEKQFRQVITSLFPEREIQFNAKKSTNLINPLNNVNNNPNDNFGYLEIDVWIPDLKLGFEYQYIKRDELKYKMMEERGYTLIVVPCWWDRNPESIISLVRERRSELFQEFSSKSLPSLSKVPPVGFFNEEKIPGIVGELMWPSFPPTSNFDPSNWWIGEKYDGMRICWNGVTQQLYSKHATSLTLPHSMIKMFPSHHFLDGEAWLGRGNFNDCIRLMTSPTNSSLPYADLRLVIFDDPNPESRLEKFETRFEKIASRISETHPFLFLAPFLKCLGSLYLESMFTEVLMGGGEGIVTRKNESFYESGRSKSIYKFKTQRDAEALIIDRTEDGYTCKLSDGGIFESKNILEGLENELSIGDVVSFKYTHTSQYGKPVGVHIYRIRKDVVWDSETEFEDDIPDLNLEKTLNRNPMGYWTRGENSNSNMKSFFDSFASRNSFDPLVAHNWYSVKRKNLELAGGAGAIQHFGSVITALQNIYPDIGLKKESFPYFKEHDWKNVEERKAFMDEFAKKNEFDPLIAENWRSVLRKDIVNSGGSGLLNHYKGSLASALSSLYSFNIEPCISETDWKDKTQQRNFFDEFARANGFDPLSLNNWYNIKRRDIIKSGGSSILKYYRDSHIYTLISLYPQLKWNINSCKRYKEELVHPDRNTEKMFLFNFAQKKEFDPLVLSNWLQVSRKDFSDNGGKSVLTHYKGSLLNAVQALIPDLKK